ncbi:MAG: hypothetical protein K2L34_07935 [Muribaculaceae bacterium]|nr:hypothetical protein [Muribaculaceae bacterium]
MVSRKLKSSEKDKISTSARRIVAKTYGFKQSSYCNWIVKDGYIFIVYDLGSVSLRVKPLYFDDIFWEMLGIKDTMSGRAKGMQCVRAIKIAEYELPSIEDNDYTKEKLVQVWQTIFQDIIGKIEDFLVEHPYVDKYEVHQQDCYDVAPIMVLCHHGQYEEALRTVEERMAQGEAGFVRTIDMSTMTEYTEFDKIKEYCEAKIAETRL